MEIQTFNVDDIKPYPGNPRINDNAVGAVMNSLQDFGFQQPLVVDADNILVVGHTRLEAAKRLGIAEVPVVVASDLSTDKARAYRIADNRTGELSQWDWSLLRIEAEALVAVDALELTGFDAVQLSELLADEVPDDAVEKKGDGAGQTSITFTLNDGDMELLKAKLMQYNTNRNIAINDWLADGGG